MDVVYHRLIKKDLRDALTYYDRAGGEKLGDRFFEDAEATVDRFSQSEAFSLRLHNASKSIAGILSLPLSF